MVCEWDVPISMLGKSLKVVVCLSLLRGSGWFWVLRGEGRGKGEDPSLSMMGEFYEAVSGCEDLKTSSSHRSSHLTVFGGFSRQRENGPIESTERG